MSSAQPTFTVQLHQLRLYGYHGLYQEEKILGAEFELNISMQIEAPQPSKISIHDTINYADVYQLVKQIFSNPEALLETLCLKISVAIKEQFPSLKQLSLQIIKMHPPITGFIGSVSVTYQKSY